ncbi:hypothetical protein GCM10007887_20020 [Methylobacterium haplocladii]|uniref:Uncharacterized protein n=2 Tax=Methylobacterium haplocladii TaxID=1176176 RepID=A0A512IQS0_9HYPH|nr:hypothetical protein MHA02_24520 [Methylobacterium haplocladii]GJD86504.1 hypothetical protein HPGCJGGD_4411 [Methylobacterium haplocladii]GLS59336.1 hypothetical protein GCM10007887_20020 [Methylobacterium haplocladii]
MSAGPAITPFPDRHLRVRSTESPAMQRTMSSPTRQHQEALQFRLILAATYPFFLIAALVQRVLPGGAVQRPGLPVARRSVFGEAKAMAVSAIPFAFMG